MTLFPVETFDDPMDLLDTDTDHGDTIRADHELVEASLGFLSDIFESPVDSLSNALRGIQENLLEQVYGTPWVSEFFWALQKFSYNCTVAIQTCILKAYGYEVTEVELTELAKEHGWLTEDGAGIEDIAKVLEYFGVETHINPNATVDDLINELQQGHAVIIPVDSGELWADTFLEKLWEYMEDVFGLEDHVIWITGIDMSDPDNPYVIVNDTGHPDGSGERYPLSQLIDAWEDADFHYVATNEAPPDYDAYVTVEGLWRKAA